MKKTRNDPEREARIKSKKRLFSILLKRNQKRKKANRQTELSKLRGRTDNEDSAVTSCTTLHPGSPPCDGSRHRGPSAAGAVGPLGPPVASVGSAGPMPSHVLAPWSWVQKACPPTSILRGRVCLRAPHSYRYGVKGHLTQGSLLVLDIACRITFSNISGVLLYCYNTDIVSNIIEMKYCNKVIIWPNQILLKRKSLRKKNYGSNEQTFSKFNQIQPLFRMLWVCHGLVCVFVLQSEMSCLNLTLDVSCGL